MPLLRVPILKKKEDSLVQTYLFFLKIRPRLNCKGFSTKFGPQWKDWINNYQIKQVLSLLYKLVTLISD